MLAIKLMIVGLGLALSLAAPENAGEIIAACAGGYFLIPRLLFPMMRRLAEEEDRLKREARDMVRRNDELEAHLKRLEKTP